MPNLRELRSRWWPTYKTNVYTDITVLNTNEMVNTKVNLDQFEVHQELLKHFK